jgi:gliding motility-associated-like protein
MKKYIILFFLACIVSPKLFATHNVAGEITYRPIGTQSSNCHQYEITVTTYTDMTSAADRCSLTVDFGDGTSALVYRSNRPAVPFANQLCTGGYDGDPVGPNYPNFKKNIYIVTHTYTAAFTYIISMADPNRVKDICNIDNGNSVNIKFYIQSVLVINDVLGCNSSPQLTNLPLDKACTGQCFYHNPGAYNPDASTGVNDSLHYSLSPCMDTTQHPLSSWSGLPVTPGGTLSIDPVTGLMEWCSPTQICNYNICIKIEKWRKYNGHYYFMGYVLRDMQILSSSCNNTNPILTEPHDTCLIAGSQLNFNVKGSDPNFNNWLNLTASGDVFHGNLPLAVFPTYPASGNFGPQPARSQFSWTTSCDHVQIRPHQVTFRLENNDNGNAGGINLLDYETMDIMVIAPAPKNLQVTPFGQTMKLHWNPETCNPSKNGFVYYEIFRREGMCDTNRAGYCTTSVPSSWGYTFVGTTHSGLINDTTFTDNNNGQGLVTGVTFSYRVVAYFTDGAESQPSKNVCAQLKRDIPVITHVDVDSTSATAGQIILKWQNAVSNTATYSQGLDTVAYPGPYSLDIFRSPGFTLSNPTLIKTFTAPDLHSLNDTLADHQALDTQDSAWTYRINFYATGTSGPVLIGYTQRASSVYLSLTPSDHKLTLSWQQNVPWLNYRYKVYKETAPNIWTAIGTSNTNTYADSNLINHHTYCYYVTSYGSYFNVALPDTLLNRSQHTCMAPVDNTPPCPPQLLLASDCENAQNALTWTDPNHYCADDVVSYNIWYSPTGDGPLQIIKTVSVSSDTNLVFSNLISVAGCYAVSALDSNAVNQSVLSNIVCADNCPLYQLPNVFTPNGDNTNDLFSALIPFRYIESVDMKIYDRWGALLFQTKDPNILWDGKSMQSGKLCTDGVYYYVCQVNARRLVGIVPYQLKGFIQLASTPQTNH